MRRLQTGVLVIGGGATGAGVLRDLAMRGLDTLLVEQRDLNHGTTGRYHGLLHSGARYAVKDPRAAVECIEENSILRRIMPQCIEDTGGFFVLTPADDPDYVPEFLAGCRGAGIPAEEVPVRQMLREEPNLSPEISLCYRVPDAAADSFLATEANAESARLHGAGVHTYHEVRSLMRQGNRVVGAVCHDLVGGESVEISADLVINASGAWAGRVAEMAGIEVRMLPGKGTMVAVNHRVVNTVVNRLKVPSDADILVPIQTVAVMGTTDEQVSDPERFTIEPWEVELMMTEGERLVPGFRELRVLRAWAGVRPLYEPSGEAGDTREVTRAYALLDHEERDGLEGFLTITGGKWTTYRQMAEVTVDAACRKLGIEAECRTHLEALPDPPSSTVPLSRRPLSEKSRQHFLGARLAEIEAEETYGDLICECELATRADVEQAIIDGDAKTIDDVRRDVRLGMGPCQGGFCTYRVAGILQALRRPPVDETNVALRDFLQERWKGLLPILRSQQLRQERLDELIYLSVLNADHLPGPESSRLGPVPYEAPEER